jgi:hypothetical protein
MASGLPASQQLFAAVLVAGIVGAGSAVFSDILYHPEELEEPAYKIEVANAAEGAGAGGPAVAEEQPVAVLLASADLALGEKTPRSAAPATASRRAAPTRWARTSTAWSTATSPGSKASPTRPP